MKKLSDYLATFADMDLSPLLGISLEEYAHLIHQPLYQYKNEHGAITEFFMFISPANRPELLQKIKTEQGNCVRFRPQDIFELRRKQFQVSNQMNNDVASVNFY
jgi:hypothetical protein